MDPQTMEGMKLAYCIHSLHRTGGMERVLVLKANYLAEHLGYEVYIITAHAKGRPPYFHLSEKVRCIDLGVNENIFKAGYRKRLNAALREIRPDISISLGGADVFCLDKCTDGSVKMAEYHFSHDKYFLKYRNRLFAQIRSRLLFLHFLKYDRVVVLSGYDLDFFRSFAEKNGVCPGKFISIANPITVKDIAVSTLKDKRFLCVGRLSPEKGFDAAIRIWKLVAERHPDWSLDICGDGPERNGLQKMIDGFHLENNVHLCGNRPFMSAEYSRAGGLLLTSKYEGFPLAVLEACGSGLPVVAFDIPGGLQDMVSQGKNGLLIPDRDIAAAADGICSLIEDSGLRQRLGAESLAVADRYSIDNVMSLWDNLFTSLRNGTEN